MHRFLQSNENIQIFAINSMMDNSSFWRDNQYRNVSVDEPLLSICIPTYNRAESLRGTLQSLLELRAPDIEVVVTDNGSPDHTQQVVDEFQLKFKYFRRHRHQKNMGPAKNAAACTTQARGTYSYILCDDDRMIMEGVGKAVQLMEAEPDLVAVYGGHQEWEPKEDRILQTCPLVQEKMTFAKGDWVSLFSTFGVLWSPVVRTSIAQRFFVQDDSDFGMWPLANELLRRGSVAVVPGFFYKHAQTVPRMEYSMTEAWFHDFNRAQYEKYIGRIGRSADPAAFANFLMRRTVGAYVVAIRFALEKKEYLKARHFMMRARAYGAIEEPEIFKWERENIVPMLAERLCDHLELLPTIDEVLFEKNTLLNAVKQQFIDVAPNYRVRDVDLQTVGEEGLQEGQFLVTYAHQGEASANQRVVIAPTRYRALQDLIETCRITDQPLSL